jgi:hypothetical protein
MRCSKCGLSLGSHQVHLATQCEAQQEKNRILQRIPCQWCGWTEAHKEGCPADDTCKKKSVL